MAVDNDPTQDMQRLGPEDQEYLNKTSNRKALESSYEKSIQNPPQMSDFHPGLARRIIGGMQEMTGNSKEGMNTEYSPYYRQYQDYLNRTQGMRQALDHQDEIALHHAQITHLGAQALAEGARGYQEQATGKLREFQATPEHDLAVHGYQPKNLEEKEDLEQYNHPEAMRPTNISGPAIFNPYSKQLEQNPYYVPPQGRESESEKLDIHMKERDYDIKHPTKTQEEKPKKLNFDEAWKRVSTNKPMYQEFRQQDPKTKKFNWVKPTDPKKIPIYNQMVKDLNYEMQGGSGLQIDKKASGYKVEEVDEE